MKENFNGNLKDVIIYLITSGVDSCEITNTVNDISVTLDVTIKKITSGDQVIYDAGDEENCAYELYNEDGEFVS